MAQNYVSQADSCFKAKNYSCAAQNYDLFLQKVEGRSNVIAYRAATSWSLTGDKDRAFNAISIYIRNNYLNGVIIFSKDMIAEKSFDRLKNDIRWQTLISGVITKEDSVVKAENTKTAAFKAIQINLENNSTLKKLNFTKMNALQVYNKIKKYNSYQTIKRKYLSMQIKLTDSLNMAYLIVLPNNYNPKKHYPLLFFLHGAVSSNTGYLNYVDETDTSGWNRYYTKYANLNKIIMVYPHANKDYNWMYPDKGFFMVPTILKQIKQVINIDDDKVFISGHSNGATGSFSYLMKQPSPYAGFYGFNTRPVVATGGTFLRNIYNRSFFNVSVDQDYYYPPQAHDSLNNVMKNLKADYQDHRYTGFPHWFPQFNESEPAYALLFDDLNKRKRDPFHHNIYWECDDTKYGRCDWLSITLLDTVSKKAPWQKNINFKINKWIVLDKKNKAVTRDTSLNAFVYKKTSGAIKANFNNNVFTVSTSSVKSFSLFISPQMVNINKPVIVVVNGKTCYKGKVKYNKAFMINEFKNTADRKAIWINHIDIKVL
ncbi:MAG: hypothetical protein ABI308_03925 [Mucilaginibacter sp.]